MSKEAKKGEDVMLLGEPLEEDAVPFVHYREDGVAAGVLTSRDDLGGYPCRLHAHEDRPGYWVEWKDGARPEPSGPSMVNSKAYRDNWGRIFSPPNLFGSEVEVGEA